MAEDRVIERLSEMELLGSTAASVWAEQFVDRFKGRMVTDRWTEDDEARRLLARDFVGNPMMGAPITEDTMLGWFANAVMAGYDMGRRGVARCAECGSTDFDHVCPDPPQLGRREAKP